MLLGVTAVAGALGVTALVSHVMPVDAQINSAILLIGLAVGIDYSLFYLRRAREERALGEVDQRTRRWPRSRLEPCRRTRPAADSLEAG